MSHLYFIKPICLIASTIIFSLSCHSQEATVTINQPKKLTQILSTRKQMLQTEEIRTHYTLQVFAGTLEQAQDVLKTCKKKINDHKTQIHYETPYYKVWVGEFRNKLAADRALLSIKDLFPDALAIKPRNKKTHKGDQ